jgi:type II secretory pathway component PulJ
MTLRIKRPGFSLIEVLVFISVGSVIFFLAIQLIHLSLRISRTANQRWQQDAVLSRLSREFRRDMHLATRLELISATQLRVKLDNDRSDDLSLGDGNMPSRSESRQFDQTVDWNFTNQLLRRTSRLGQQPAIEDFQLGESYQAKLEYEPSTKLIRLTVSRKNEAGELTSRIERLVECQVSDDVKLAEQPESNPADASEDRP